MDLPDKKTRIIQAAIKVFAKSGLEKGKIADVALEAGIGKGTVYEYFSSKDAIFEAIENFIFSDITKEFETLKSSALSPPEKIRTIITLSLDFSMEMGDAILVLTELAAKASRGQFYGHTPSDAFEKYKTYKNEIESILEDGIQSNDFRHMNTEGVATLLMAFLDGMALQIAYMKNYDIFTNIKQEAMESFMRGVEK